ncbi:uncharacterized protein [Atheta coriaria]|uniref:uncharacterized protein n=1 Tax=Dalotia coriaria TaxID=877792 RepID=UPI0031F35D70
MFSTPSARINNQENADSVMRKPQFMSARKAFQDRGVNNKANQFLRNTPINKPNLKPLCIIKTPDVKLQENQDAPSWMTSMSFKPPRNEMDMIQFSSSMFKANMYSRPPTPPPSPLKDFELDFELMRLPPTMLNFDNIAFPNIEPSADLMLDSDLDLLLEKPHTNFDY